MPEPGLPRAAVPVSAALTVPENSAKLVGPVAAESVPFWIDTFASLAKTTRIPDAEPVLRLINQRYPAGELDASLRRVKRNRALDLEMIPLGIRHELRFPRELLEFPLSFAERKNKPVRNTVAQERHLFPANEALFCRGD